MVSRSAIGCACGALLGMLVQAGTAVGAEHDEGPGGRMPPSYNPATGGAMPSAPGGGSPAGANYGKGKGSGPGTPGPGASQKQNASGDPLKGLNVHKSVHSEDKSAKCHDLTTSLYYKC